MNIRCPNCQTVFRVDPSRIPAAGIRARCARCGNTFQVSRESGSAPQAQQPAPPAQQGPKSVPPPEPVAPPRAPQPSAAQPPAPQPPAAERPQPAESAPAAPQAPAPHAAGATQATTPVSGGEDSRQEQRTGSAAEADVIATPRPDAGAAPARAPAGSTAAPRNEVAAPQTSTGRTGDAPLGPATPAFRGGAAPAAAPPRPQQSRPATPATAPVFGSRDPRARAQRIARALVSDIVAYHPKRRDECLAAGNLRTEFRDEIMKSWEEYVAQVGEEMAKGTPYFRNALNDILAKGQSLF